jgi:A/G-specific adenine glycosylase
VSPAAVDAVPLRRALMRWYRENGRHSLPWRLTRDPYAVVVSEVMLQQTQVERVRPCYDAWLERWPTVQCLAEASPADVIRAWSGLGYNRRALNLHRLAIEVAARGWPAPLTERGLRGLPGIGPYTASALLSFAHDERVAVLDTNIARVVARVVLGVGTWRLVPGRGLATAAGDLLPRRGVRDHNLALMDLGAQVCTARAPQCGACPLARMCAWRMAGAPRDLTDPASAVVRFEESARFARGRIVEALRGGPATDDELRALLPPEHRPRMAQYLRALARDGLAVGGDDGWWSLPGITAG